MQRESHAEWQAVSGAITPFRRSALRAYGSGVPPGHFTRAQYARLYQREVCERSWAARRGSAGRSGTGGQLGGGFGGGGALAVRRLGICGSAFSPLLQKISVEPQKLLDKRRYMVYTPVK